MRGEAPSFVSSVGSLDASAFGRWGVADVEDCVNAARRQHRSNITQCEIADNDCITTLQKQSYR